MKDEQNIGPAFPSTYKRVDNGYQVVSPGMSLRDYFAGQAAIALVCGATFRQNNAHVSDDAAQCYVFADAMLAERVKQS